jgi:ferric-dicitrate binding protein FerR (iron transport regulator)
MLPNRLRWTLGVAMALAVHASVPAEATHAGFAAGDGKPPGGPILLAQLRLVGNAENVLGALTVKRADGRIDQLQGKGALPLFEGDECKTARGSQAFVRLADGTQLAMNEDTVLVLRARTERGLGIIRIFKLFVGEIWLKTVGARSIEVETPVATAAIKGTELNLQVLTEGKSVLTVIEGVVEFGTPFGTCPIPASTQSFGERGKRCTKPVPINPAPVVAWVASVVPR